MVLDTKDPKVEEIGQANTEAFDRLRELANDLGVVVEHESRVLEEESPEKG